MIDHKAIEKYIKVRKLAVEGSAGEKQAAQAIREKMQAEHPNIDQAADAYEAIVAGTANTQTSEPHKRSESPDILSALWSALGAPLAADIAQAAREELVDAVRETRERAIARTRSAVRRAFSSQEVPPMANRRRANPPASRQSIDSLLEKIDISGAVFAGNGDDDDDVVLCLTIPADALSALLDKITESPKADSKLGATVFSALAETLENGEYGDFPFDTGDAEDDDAE